MLSLSNRRLATAIALSLLPLPAVWFGMYKLQNISATFFLYHGLCLLPACIWQRRLWLPSLRKPSRTQILLVVSGAAIACACAIFAYQISGTRIINRVSLLETLTTHGFAAAQLIPLGVYFVIVNATLEELFWRGVILNELENILPAQKKFGMAWAACTFALWHYLVLRLLLQKGWAELTVVALVIFGASMSVLYRRTQSIILPIIWHGIVFDLALIMLLGFILQTH